MEERGSEKWRREVLPEAELERLWRSLEEDEAIDLLHWWWRGQPAVDAIAGVVRVSPETAGKVVDKLVNFERLRLNLDVFPYGIPVPREVLIRFEQGQPGA